MILWQLGKNTIERWESMMEKQKRMVLLDWLKAGSILCIIINHTGLEIFYCFLHNWGKGRVK